MKRLLISIFIIAFLFGSSCKKELTETSYSTISPTNFYKTQSDFEVASLGIYGIIEGGNLYSWFLHYARHWQGGDYDEPVGTQFHDLTWTPSWYFLDPTWVGYYQAINNINTELSHLDGVSFTQANKDALTGELYFLRAFCYFDLVKAWGGVPLHLKPTVSTDNVSLPRSSAADVYTQIIADLQKAKGLLNVTSIYGPGRATKGAASGMLARVYVYMAGSPVNDNTKWQAALTELQSIVDPGYPAASVSPYSYHLEPDYQNLFWQVLKQRPGGVGLPTIGKPADENGPESLFELNFKSVPGYQGAIYPNSLVGTSCSQWLNNQFDSNDYRRSVTMVTSPTDPLGTVRLQRKFQPTGTTWNDADNNWPVIRYADLILLYAEVENEINGPTANAYLAINTIRTRARSAGGTVRTAPADYDPGAGLSKDDFRKLVLKERILELSLEGGLWFDWIRTNTLQQVLTDQGRGAFFDTKIGLFPIPQTEVDITQKVLTQNPGY